MAAQPARRGSRRAPAAEAGWFERRGWLSHGLLALGISALGLAAAGSFALTTNAQPLPAPDPGRVSSVTSRAPLAVEPQRTPSSTSVLGTYAPRGEAAAGGTDQNPVLRAAVVKEQAAQRAEELAKGAEGITRATQTASSKARQDQLDAADLAAREAAKRASEERLRRAIEARVAAAAEREASEEAPPATPGTPSTPAPELSNVPAGGGGGGTSPVPGAVIGSRFGQYGVWSRYHTGIDFRASYGTPIRAVKAGVVVFAGNRGDWAGNHVAVRHGDGKTTMSSHMSSMAVSSGSSVQAGQVIGYVGETGRAFGAHLHFELYPPGVRHGDVYRAIDPQPWLSANGVRTR